MISLFSRFYSAFKEWRHPAVEQSVDPNNFNEMTVSKLLSHPIFQEFRAFDTVKIDSLTIDDPIKKKMAVVYLKILYSNIEKGITQMVYEYDTYSNSPSKIGEILRAGVVQTRKTAVGEGVPMVFIRKYEPKTNSTISIITNVMIEAHQYRMYSTTYDEICSVLDSCLIYLRIEIESAENMINEMNGELHHALIGSVFDDM